jgi:hypothetical protein
VADGVPLPDLLPATRPAGCCPDCDGPVKTETIEQAAMLWHGGYGETRATVVRWCPCGCVLVAGVLSERPRW